MLVKELIEKLKLCNPDSEVTVHEEPIWGVEYDSTVDYVAVSGRANEPATLWVTKTESEED